MSGEFEVDGNITVSRFDVPLIGLWYPRCDGSAKEIEIELMDVRAADSIRVSYDFDRDGWVIRQSDGDLGEDGNGETWHEVAFVQAWALQKPEDDEPSGLREAK